MIILDFIYWSILVVMVNIYIFLEELYAGEKEVGRQKRDEGL